MKRLLIILISLISYTHFLDAFTINFVVSSGSDFQTSDQVSTNGINVSIITFNSFTPVAGEITFQDIIDNSTVLVEDDTITTSNPGFTVDGTVVLGSANITGIEGTELYAFANFNNQEF